MLVWDPPAFEDENIEQKVHEILEKLGVTIYKELDLKGIVPNPNTNEIHSIKFTNRAWVKPEDDEQSALEDDEDIERSHDDDDRESEEEDTPPDEVELFAKFFVTSRCNDIDLGFFQAIHDNGLVYNGRLIVKNNFQTTDPAIFAAGRLCEFSQRYKNLAIGTSLRLDKYSGREVGQKLAKAILEHIGLVTAETAMEEEELPVFYMPLGTGGVLPNDLFYYHVRRIEWARPSLTVISMSALVKFLDGSSQE